MNDIDFTSCEFINEFLCFLTYYDFCKNAKVIKTYYNALEDNARRFYKWYVYANIHMEESYKNYIWNYLNSSDENSYIELIDKLNKYKVK